MVLTNKTKHMSLFCGLREGFLGVTHSVMGCAQVLADALIQNDPDLIIYLGICGKDSVFITRGSIVKEAHAVRLRTHNPLHLSRSSCPFVPHTQSMFVATTPSRCTCVGPVCLLT